MKFLFYNIFSFFTFIKIAIVRSGKIRIENIQNNNTIIQNKNTINNKTSILKTKSFDFIQFNTNSSYLKENMDFENNDILKSNLKGNISLYKIEKINKMKNITTNKIENKELYRNINVSFDEKENIKSHKIVNYLNKIKKKKTKNLNKNRKKKIKNKLKENHQLRKKKINQSINLKKSIKGNIKINWDFSILCKDELNIMNLSLEFIPTIKKSKDYFTQMLKKKKKIINNKKSSNHLENLNCKIKTKEKIILTMKSWKKRINYCHKSIEILLTNSLPPYKLILNLAKEEFQKKNLELPKNLLNLLKYDNFEIFWVEENNNVFKKLIPTINRFKEDLIITVDDDVIYPNDMIEKVITLFRKYGSKFPISFGGRETDWKFIKKKKNSFKKIRISSHYGACSIVKYNFFKSKLMELYIQTTEPQIKKGIKCFDDFLYTYAALLNGYFYLRSREYSIRKYVYFSPKLNAPFSKMKSKKKVWKKYHNSIKSYIKKKYHISVVNLIIYLRKHKIK